MRVFRAIFVGLVVGLALAGPARACVEAACDHGRHVPADVDVFVSLEEATLEDWTFLAGVSGAGDEASAAWRELGGVLGLDESEAFERLVGSRASIALRGVWGEEDAEWAALLTTDDGTAKRFRKAFRATPRRIVGGKAVLALEGGRFLAAVLPHREGVVLALAPAGSGEGALFERICGGVGNEEASLASTERHAALGAFGTARRYSAAVRLPDGKGWVAGGAASVGAVTRVELAGRLTEAEPPEAVIDPAGWEALFEGALFATVERAGSLVDLDEKATAGSPLALFLPLIEAMGPSAGDVGAMVVRPTEGGAALGGAFSMVAPEKRAERLDAAASRTLGLIGQAYGEGAWEHDFLGLFPEARRRVDFESGPDVMWQYLGRGWQPGWVVFSTEGELMDDLVETARAEAAEMKLRVTLDGEGLAGVPAAGWRSVGAARPSAMLDLARGGGGAAPALLERLSRLERIEWAVRDLPEGRLDGWIVVERGPRVELAGDRR